jgi:hypothetical protein
MGFYIKTLFITQIMRFIMVNYLYLALIISSSCSLAPLPSRKLKFG